MFNPTHNYVVLKRHKLKSGSLFIPEDAGKRNAPARGTVLAVGPICEPYIKKLVGKEVSFKRHAGTWLEDGDDEIYIVDDTDILAEITDG